MRIHITITDERGKHYEGDAELAMVKQPTSKSVKIVPEDKKKPAYHIRQLYIRSFFNVGH